MKYILLNKNKKRLNKIKIKLKNIIKDYSKLFKKII